MLVHYYISISFYHLLFDIERDLKNQIHLILYYLDGTETYSFTREKNSLMFVWGIVSYMI